MNHLVRIPFSPQKGWRYLGWLFGCLVLAGLLVSGASSQVAPEKALTQFTVSPGLEITLWASEPMFTNPTCMDMDHKGRVWVCESVNYRHKLRKQPPRRPEGDRILILEDSNGTGKADKVIVFYQSPDTLAPLGIAVAPDIDGPGCKVYVCQSPDILVFEDRDGDSKADGPPTKLLSGFRGFDHDHGVHGILIGPDGKLYFSVGDQGVNGLVDKDGKKWTTNSTDCRAGTVWRCDLDGKNLELIAHNFRNEYEPCVDSFGTIFVSDNDDDGNQQTRICYVMPGGNYGYHPRGKGESHWHEEQPGVVHKILRTYFGSPTGMCVYEGALLPKKYQGELLHTDAGPRHLRCYHLQPKGAGYTVELENMVQSSDNWFRPADVCVAPDGSVFIADWYDPGVGGHGMGDITRGRVYRIAPKGSKTLAPKVDLDTQEGLLDALASPNLATRYMAMTKLNTMDKARAFTALEKAATQKENVFLRARALWQLGKMNNLKLVRSAFYDDDPRFRILAMRILIDFQDQNPADYTMEWQQRLIKDPSAAVRREGLLLLRNADPAKAKALILQLAKTYDGEDRFFLSAVGIAVGHLDKDRRDVILADFEKEFPKWNPQVAGLIWELRPPKVLPLLEKQLADGSLPSDQRKKVVDIVAASPEVSAGELLLKEVYKEKSPAVREAMMGHLQAHLPGKWSALKEKHRAYLKTAIEQLVTRQETVLEGLSLIGVAEWEIFLPLTINLANAERQTTEIRRAAIETVARFKTSEATDALLAVATSAKGDKGLALAAVLALGKQKTKKSLKTLESLATDTQKYSLAQRQAALAGLARSRPGTIWLLDAYGKSELAQDLKGDLTRLLHNSPYPDLRAKALQLLPAPGKLDPKNLPSIVALLAKQGNAKKGRDLHLASMNNQVQCMKCHSIRGVGGNVGPDLSMIGKKASKENLLESILYPSKAIADQYVTWSVETQQGLVINGLLIEDSPKQVVLRDANAQDHTIKRGDIANKVKSPISIMPDNLLLYMSEGDLVDMVEYLYTLKTPALAPTMWNIIGPFPGGKGEAFLKKSYPPEKEINLQATYKGKSGDLKWQKIQPDNKGYVDLKNWLKDNSNATTSYVHCEIDSPVAQSATILLGTDDTAKLWVNGKAVYTNIAHRPAVPEQDQVKVNLQPGRNMLLLRIGNGNGDHGFYLTIMSEEPVTMSKN